jgi:N-acetylglucosamine-6-sulfatase
LAHSGTDEHHGLVQETLDPDIPGVSSGNPITYEAIRARGGSLVEYANGEREFHDRATDP